MFDYVICQNGVKRSKVKATTGLNMSTRLCICLSVCLSLCN